MKIRRIITTLVFTFSCLSALFNLGNEHLAKNELNLDNPVPFMMVEKAPVFSYNTEIQDEDDRINTYLAIREYVLDKVEISDDSFYGRQNGKVVVKFVVDKTGKTKNVKIVNHLGFASINNVKDIIYSMPNWTPGLQNGKAVDVSITLPITFIFK